jgi:hypothetical protein
MKRTFSTHGWLIASICFFGLGSLGVSFDTGLRLTEGANGTKYTDWLYGYDLSYALGQMPDLYPVSIQSRCSNGTNSLQYRAALKSGPSIPLYVWVYDVDESAYISNKAHYQKYGYTESSHSYSNCKGAVLHQSLLIKNR